MPVLQWPCNPESFASILTGDLPFFLQTGAVHSLGRAASIIDPKNFQRVDPLNRFDKYTHFCGCLRNGCSERRVSPTPNHGCTACDLRVAQVLIAEQPSGRDPAPQIIRYRCYMGLEEMAAVITVAGFPFMIVTGQFKPAEGLGDLKAALSCLGRRKPSEVSSAMSASMDRFKFEDDYWVNMAVSDAERAHLWAHAQTLEVLTGDDEQKMRDVVKRIADIARSYHEMGKAKIEAKILQDVAQALAKAGTDHEDLWKSVTGALEVFRSGINVKYVAFFSGRTEADTVLTLRASAGDISTPPAEAQMPHYNWRKAGIRTQDERDTPDQDRDWDKFHLSSLDALLKGFRGSWNPFRGCAALVPVKLPTGPFGLLVLGPQLEHVDLCDHEEFTALACRDLVTRLLTLQLAQVLHDDREDWEKTSKMTGHRVRAAIQNLGSNLKTIRAVHAGRSGFGQTDLVSAEADLALAFRDLTEVSYAAEASIPRAINVRISHRENVPLGEMVWAAADAQRKVADEHNIQLTVKPDISALSEVYANPTLLRYAFINLINNALKYSHPHPTKSTRTVEVSSAVADFGEARVEISNFGLGIKEIDKDRIFEWGVRLAEKDQLFQGIYGKGIGLWEVKHIVEGHGGRVFVRSVHHSRAPVTDANIKQCITVFTVSLRTA